MKVAIAHRQRATIRAVEHAVRTLGTHQIIWTTSITQDIFDQCVAQPPDLLLLDSTIRDPSASTLTRRLVEKSQCAVVLLADKAGSTDSKVFESMGAGALDVVVCPTFDDEGNLCGAESLASKLITVNRILGRSDSTNTLSAQSRKSANGGRASRLIAIGASTGGPQALYDVLSSLPRPVANPIVIVQHVDSEFVSGLAEWLSDGTRIPVKIATPGCTPVPGEALLAGSNGHLVYTRRGTFIYADEPKDVPYRPSVDALFQSLAAHWATPSIAVLLTGMGRDGAEGMRRLRAAGWRTIAQDERTSVVFGMPKAAAQLGAAERVLPIQDVGPMIGRWAAER
jgi:chemotaxis response regulator CheB